MTQITDTVDSGAPKKSPRKMKPGGGKSKGNAFEGKVAKMLSTALAPLKFIRTPGSGARVGGKNFETLGQMFGDEALKLFTADVVPVNEKEAGVVFLHSIECKFYKTPDTFGHLMSGTANLFKWMQESITDAEKTNRIPLLIMKWNNTPIYVAGLSDNSNVVPALTIQGHGMSIDLFLFEQLLAVPDFWIKARP